jgi:lipopolysaccharide biosynthesis protein
LRRKRVEEDGKSINLGAFIDWDNTARKGINSTFFIGATPEKFEKYMIRQLKRAKQLNSPFVFINAWNEWGEGTYLEPDEKYQFRYIEALKRAIDQSGIR